MNQLLLCLFCLMCQGVMCAAGPPQYEYGPYNEGRMDPQVEGWPLTAEERAYVVDLSLIHI
jgi:hypothetical protein